MLKSGELQAVTGTAADGGPWLTKAAATIRTAEEAAKAISNVKAIIDAARKIMEHLGFFNLTT